MYSSKFYKIITVLRPEEWLELKYIIKHRKAITPQVKTLFAYIFQRRTNLESKVFALDYVNSKAFPGMSKKNLQNMMSKLTLVIEDYLILKHVRDDPYEIELRRFQVYNDRNLYGLANKKAEALKEEWNNGKDLDLRKVNNVLRLQHVQYFSENPIKYEKGNFVLANLFRSFRDFNLIYNEFYSYAIDKAISTRVNDPKQFEDEELSDEFLVREISKIAININQLNKSSSRVAFDYLFDKLESNNQIALDLQVLIFGVCESYLINIIMKGQSDFDSKTILHLYQLGIKTGILLYNNSLSTIKFSNIVTIACYLEQFEWAEEYIKKYINLVPVVEREENLLFARVKIHFGKWEYEKALKLINRAELNIYSLKEQSRWYSLVIYFITFDNLDFLESQISSFMQFFYYNKKRMSHRNFDGSLNLAKIFRSSVNYGKQFDLDAEIGKYENIIFKNRLHSIFEQRRIYKKNNNIDL